MATKRNNALARTLYTGSDIVDNEIKYHKKVAVYSDRLKLFYICIFVALGSLNIYMVYDSFMAPNFFQNEGQKVSPSKLLSEYKRLYGIKFYSSSNMRKLKAHSSLESQFSPSKAITVVAMAGETGLYHPGFDNFKKSLKFCGYKDVKILKPPSDYQEILALRVTNQSAESRFWVQRLAQFEKLSHDYDAHHILVFCDAYDIFFGLPPDLLIQRYLSLQKPVIFSTEMFCDTVSCRTDYRVKEWYQHQGPSSNPYKFLNAGMFIGKAGPLNFVLKCAVQYAKEGRDDQTAFSMCYQKYPNIIGLDYNSYLFANIPPLDIIYNTEWQMRQRYDIFPVSLGYDKHLLDNPTLFLKYSNYLSISPLFFRKQITLSYSPIIIHFPGMAYRPNSFIPFNPCQQNLRWRYNDIGDVMFKDGIRPFLFHTVPQSKVLSILNNRVVIAITTTSEIYRLKLTLKSIQSLQHQSHPPDAIYIHIHILNHHMKSKENKAHDYLLWVHHLKDSHGIVSTSTDGSGSGLLDALYHEVNPYTSIILLRDHLTYDSSLIESLLIDMIRNPVYAYGTEGWMADSDDNNRADFHDVKQRHDSIVSNHHNNIRKRNGTIEKHVYENVPTSESSIHPTIELRSALHWSFKGTNPVDILSQRGGYIVRRDFFEYDHYKSFLTSFHNDKKVCLDHSLEDLVINAYLSGKGIPRLQLQYDSNKFKMPEEDNTIQEIRAQLLLQRHSQTNKQASISTIFLSHTSLSSVVTNHDLITCIHTVYPKLQLSVYNENISTEDNYDDYYHFDFHPIPPVGDLPGFSWKSNWQLESDTCPCTAHLMTRVSRNALYLGDGQYMNENQTLWSPNHQYSVKLLKDSWLCIFHENIRLYCLDSPVLPEKRTTAHYIAFWEDSICFFEGYTPYFGGTKLESGHRTKLGCLQRERNNSLVFFDNNEISSYKKEIANTENSCDSHYQNSLIPEQMWEKLYFRISDEGFLGIFKSESSSHDMLTPIERTMRMECVRSYMTDFVKII